MAAKLLHSLADENPDLQKQMGCMVGVYQIFDNHHALTTKRLSHRNPGDSQLSNGIHEGDSNNAFHRQTATLPKLVDGSYGVGIDGKQNVHDDLKESLRVLAKLQETPCYYNNEAREPQRSSNEANGSWNSISRDANTPQVSYERREVNHLSFESRETFKSAPKLKVLPIQSLDTCERSLRGSSHLTESFHSNGNLDSGFTNPPQSPGPQKRSPNVIAKLMGLELFPSSSSAGDGQLDVNKTCTVEDNKTKLLRSLRADDPSRPTGTNSTRSSLKGPTSPWSKNPDLIMKPISSSRFPIEPAPWRHVGGSRGSRKQPLKHVKVPVNNPNSFPSVYTEIENKLEDLEFKQTGKDPRALKQIMEAMQAKGLLETQKEEQAENLVTQRDYEPKSTSLGHNPRCQQSQQNTRINTSTTRDKISSFPKVPSGEPVHNRTGLTNGRAARNRTRNSRGDSASSSTDKGSSSRNIKAIQPLMKPPKVSTSTSVKNSGQVSARLQPKKLESDRSRLPTPPPDPSKPRRQSHRHLSESGTSGGKHRPKSLDMQQCGDQLTRISTELQSDNNIILQSKLDAKAPSHEQSPKCSISSIMWKKSTSRIVEDEAIEEAAMVALEHPSPVSVLDTSFYRDDEPSPVKQIPNTSEGNGAEGLNRDHSDGQWNPEDKCSSNNVMSGLTPEINHKKLQNIEHLVQKLRRLNSEHDEASTDYIASLCGNTNPDHRYISEILLASGLLLNDLGSGLTTFQLHPSGHPMNPELFFVLEQTKSSSLLLKEESNTGKFSHSKPDHEKSHRKLIFDSVNEILVGKLALFGAFPEPRINSGKLAKKSLTVHQLLKELCFEIEQLQAKKEKCELEENEDVLKRILWEDVTSRPGSWTDFNGEISGMVLDVERLVFKDLVNEIVIGEEGSLRAKQSRWQRRLFSK